MRTDRVVQEALQRVLAVVDAEKVVLFGSVARGTARPDSDLDLLVVADCATHRAVLRELHQALAELAIPVDLHLVAPAALEGNGQWPPTGRCCTTARDMEKAPRTCGRQRFLDEFKSLFTTRRFRSLD
jgi:predicted nucleotidyltransferase